MTDSGVGRPSEAAAPRGSAWQQLWAATGFVCVVLFACGLLFGDLLGTSNYPALDASSSAVKTYFLENGSKVQALSFFHALSAIALVVFAVYIYAFLLREGGTPRSLAGLALAGGAMSASFLLLSALCYRTLAEPIVARDASLAHALVVFSYLAGGPAIAMPLALMVGVVAATTLCEPILPRWTGWLGVVTALGGAATATTFLGPTNNQSATYGILLVGAVLMFVWLVVTSIFLAVRVPGRARL